jgi:hypothetical protein
LQDLNGVIAARLWAFPEPNGNSAAPATHRWEAGSNTSRPNDRLFADTQPVMPAKAGIHDFICCDEGKSWMPTFVGMTVGAPPVGQSFRRLV